MSAKQRHTNRNSKKNNKRPDKHTERQERGEQQLAEDNKFDREIASPVQAKNNKQRDFLRALKDKQVVCFRAPAGVGKSFLTMCECTDWLKKGYWEKLVLTRPAVGMGKSLQALPGDLRMKFEPYMLPCVDVIKQRYGDGYYENCLGNGTIEFAPLEFIRGRSFTHLVVLDEGQNVTPDEMYTIITRIEEGGKLIVIGDPNQHDLRGQNGIDWLCDFVEDNIELQSFIQVVDASSDDIVRGGLCKMMVKARERENSGE